VDAGVPDGPHDHIATAACRWVGPAPFGEGLGREVEVGVGRRRKRALDLAAQLAESVGQAVVTLARAELGLAVAARRDAASELDGIGPGSADHVTNDGERVVRGVDRPPSALLAVELVEHVDHVGDDQTQIVRVRLGLGHRIDPPGAVARASRRLPVLPDPAGIVRTPYPDRSFRRSWCPARRGRGAGR
jgi:hypothetical protein